MSQLPPPSQAPHSAPPPGFQPVWGRYDGSGLTRQVAAPPTPSAAAVGDGDGGGDELDPLSRRLMQVVRALSVLLIAVVANSFLNSSEETSLKLNLNPVAQAAERTRSLPGARFALRVTYTSASLPRPVAAAGSGAYNSETGRSRARLVLHTAKTGRIELESVSDGTSVYMRSGAFGGRLPDGKEWLEVQPFLGHSEEEAMVGGGGESSLQMLSTAGGSVNRVGRERVRGVATTRYRSVIDLADYADLLRADGDDDLADEYEKLAVLMPGPVTGEAWVDAKGLVRRSRTVMAIPTEPGQPTVTMDMRTDLYDFGARPQVELPDSDRVYDATPLVEERLDEVDAG